MTAEKDTLSACHILLASFKRPVIGLFNQRGRLLRCRLIMTDGATDRAIDRITFPLVVRRDACRAREQREAMISRLPAQ